MMPMTASSPIQGAHSAAARGRIGNGDAHETVGAQLQQDRRQDDRTLRRGLGVGVGEPGVERPHRDLDAEPHEHAAEDQHLGGEGDVAGGHQALELAHVERLGPGEEVERQEADDHQRRPEQGEQEELDGRVLPFGSAPDADHEVHRQEHDLEEHEEQDQVLGDERAEHAGVQYQDQDQEALGILRLGEVVPRVDDHQGHDQRGEQDQRKGDAVDAEDVPGVDDVDPRLVDHELEVAVGQVPHLEAPGGDDGDHQGDHRGDERDLLEQRLLILRDEHHHGGADQRHEHQEAQSPAVPEIFHGFR